MVILTISIAFICYFFSPQVRLLDFKIKSIDNALVSDHFNISQKLSLLKLQDQLVIERYHAIREYNSKYIESE